MLAVRIAPAAKSAQETSHRRGREDSNRNSRPQAAPSLSANLRSSINQTTPAKAPQSPNSSAAPVAQVPAGTPCTHERKAMDQCSTAPNDPPPATRSQPVVRRCDQHLPQAGARSTQGGHSAGVHARVVLHVQLGDRGAAAPQHPHQRLQRQALAGLWAARAGGRVVVV